MADDRQPPLDELDRHIIEALRHDGRKSFRELSDELGVPPSSVRYRVQRLEESGALRVVAVADPHTLGFERLAIVGVTCRPGTVRDVCAALSTLAETNRVVLTTGTYDLLLDVVCRDDAHFTELLVDRVQRIPGVRTTEAFVVLEAHRRAYGWGGE